MAPASPAGRTSTPSTPGRTISGQCTGLGITASREPGTCVRSQSAVPRVSATTRAARG
ncbi:Uncharacterised protein [Bordetella pertussis]|nr:Uncharacterised protein [Bordetella pertussis]